MDNFYKTIIFFFSFFLFNLNVRSEGREDTFSPDQQNSKNNNGWGNLRFSGYIQGEMEVGQKDATLFVGGPKAPTENTFTRFGILRGRLKASYTNLI